MQRTIIGLSGAARSGKDYAATHIINLYGGQTMRFSDPLYDLMYLIQDFVGFDRSKDRGLLQYIGTDWGRAHEPSLWIRMFDERLSQITSGLVLVPDIRFPGEADLLRDHGATLIRIERAELPDPDADWRQHPSERALDNYLDWDFHLRDCPEGEAYLTIIEQVASSILGEVPSTPNRTQPEDRIPGVPYYVLSDGQLEEVI